MRGPDGRMHAADPRQAPPDDDVPDLADLLNRRKVAQALLETAATQRKKLLSDVERAVLQQP
jgi:hypothetical protein